MPTGEQKESAAPLRNSVPHQRHRVTCRFRVPGLFEPAQEPTEGFRVVAHILDPRDRTRIGLKPAGWPDGAGELVAPGEAWLYQRASV